MLQATLRNVPRHDGASGLSVAQPSLLSAHVLAHGFGRSSPSRRRAFTRLAPAAWRPAAAIVPAAAGTSGETAAGDATAGAAETKPAGDAPNRRLPPCMPKCLGRKDRDRVFGCDIGLSETAPPRQPPAPRAEPLRQDDS